MTTQRQIPGGPFVNETATAQRQVPGGAFVNEVAAAGGGALPTLSNATFVPGSVTATSFRPRVTATY